MLPLLTGDPDRLDDYELLSRLAVGGMGVVYLGRGPGGSLAAVKVVHPALTHQSEFRARFAREVQALRQVAGPFTARLLAADPQGDPPWLAMAYVPGPTLDAAVDGYGPLPPGRVLALAAGVAGALARLHSIGWVHRDLKPGNVILSDDGPRVIDLGIAHALGSTALTQTGAIIGTRSWMAPEQLSGEGETPATDMFVWACLVVFAATGRHPFGIGRPEAVWIRVLHDPPDLTGLGHLDPVLTECAARCLAKDPAARPTADEVLARITHHAGADRTLLDQVAAEAVTVAWNAPTVPAEPSAPAAPIAPPPPPTVADEPAAISEPGPPSAPTATGLPPTVAAAPQAPPNPQPGPDGRPHRRIVAMIATVLLLAGLAIGGAILARSSPETAAPTAAPPPTAARPTAGPVARSGTVVGWGDGRYGGVSPPVGLSGVVSVSAGEAHSLALLEDGTVVGWGYNDNGEASPPPGLSGVTAVEAGAYHSLALLEDGTVVGWGDPTWGQASPPPGLSGVTAVAAGHRHSLALLEDGTVVGWGASSGQELPLGLSGVTAIAAGEEYSLAVLEDGSVVGWGFNPFGRATPPPGLSGVTAVAAGNRHSLALLDDGTVVGWGDDTWGQASPPAGLSGVTAVAAGSLNSLALLEDGTVVGWGDDDFGQASPPAGLSGVISVAAADRFGLAVTEDTAAPGAQS